MRALKKNNTWSVVPLQAGKAIVGCKWVFTVKYNSDGSVERYEARLVAKGFIQTYDRLFLDFCFYCKIEYDSMHYLKAFGVGDVWVAVGWSSDVLPVVKRMSNVAVVVPKSGSSLWADLWLYLDFFQCEFNLSFPTAIPAASRIETNQIGGRVRGPSALIHQWIVFCFQGGRAFPFKQEVIPGATPSSLETIPVEVPEERTKGRPSLDTNLIVGVPPPEIMSKCEFLEPLSDATLSDYTVLV